MENLGIFFVDFVSLKMFCTHERKFSPLGAFCAHETVATLFQVLTFIKCVEDLKKKSITVSF